MRAQIDPAPSFRSVLGPGTLCNIKFGVHLQSTFSLISRTAERAFTAKQHHDMLDLSRLQKQQLVYYSLVLIVAVLWKVLRPIRRHIWTSYDNLPCKRVIANIQLSIQVAPGLTFKEDHDSLASKHPVSSLYREWFASLGGTIRIRVRPYYRPIILTADPNFLAYVQRKSEDFEESARMGPTLRAMGLDHCIPCVSGDHHRGVKAALGTMISPSACRHYFPRMLAAAWQVT